MLQSSRTRIKRGIYTLVIVFILGFIIFGFRGVLFPPTVTLTTISDGMRVPAGVVVVEGGTRRVEALFVQGRQITRSPEGAFSLEVAVFSPYTIIEIEARDRFNKTIKKEIRLSVE